MKSHLVRFERNNEHHSQESFTFGIKIIKMANCGFSFYPKFQLIVIILICIQCHDAKLNVNNQLFPFNFEQIKFDLFSTNDFAKTNKFSSKNWTEHQQCLDELNAIRNGMKNFEPWAIQCK